MLVKRSCERSPVLVDSDVEVTGNTAVVHRELDPPPPPAPPPPMIGAIVTGGFGSWIVTLTVIGAVVALASDTIYVKLSVQIYPTVGVYITKPVALSVSAPCTGSVTEVNERVSFSISVALIEKLRVF